MFTHIAQPVMKLEILKLLPETDTYRASSYNNYSPGFLSVSDVGNAGNDISAYRSNQQDISITTYFWERKASIIQNLVAMCCN